MPAMKGTRVSSLSSCSGEDCSEASQIGSGALCFVRRTVTGWNVSPDSGHSTRSKSTRLISAGGIENPHLGQGVSSDGCTFSRLIFRDRDIKQAARSAIRCLTDARREGRPQSQGNETNNCTTLQ
jgi:hypothetical protein